MIDHTLKCHSSVAGQTKVEGPDVRRSRSMHENFYENGNNLRKMNIIPQVTST